MVTYCDYSCQKVRISLVTTYLRKTTTAHQDLHNQCSYKTTKYKLPRIAACGKQTSSVTVCLCTAVHHKQSRVSKPVLLFVLVYSCTVHNTAEHGLQYINSNTTHIKFEILGGKK